MKILSNESYEAWKIDLDSLIPAGVYPVKLVSIDPKDSDPDVLCFKLRITSGAYVGRHIRTWVGKDPARVWQLKKLLAGVVKDPAEVEYEDLEGHHFKAEVSIDTRTDNGEKVNRILRLIPKGNRDDAAASSETTDKDGLPF